MQIQEINNKQVTGFEQVQFDGWNIGKPPQSCIQTLHKMYKIREGNISHRYDDILMKCQCNNPRCNRYMLKSQARVAWWRKSNAKLCEHCYNQIVKHKGYGK